MFKRRRPQSNFSEELEAHLAMEVEQLRADGLSEEEAYRVARRNLGNVATIKERFYESSGWSWFEDLTQDVRHAFRRLRRSPSFTLTATLTLALGIGATTAIFTLIDAVLIKSLPVSNPDQLYRLGKESRCCVNLGFEQSGEFALVSNELYRYFLENTQGFEELAAFQADGTFLGVRRPGTPQAAESSFAEFVSGNYFAMFGLRGYMGRALSTADDKPDSAPVAMMSYHAWEQKYGLDPSVIGGTFNFNDKPFTIVGVTPPSFYGDRLTSMPPDFYLPLATEPLVKGKSSILDKADTHWLSVFGRVRAGTNVSMIEAQMRIELRQWLQSHWGDMTASERQLFTKQTLNLSPGGAGVTYMRQQYQRWLQVLMMITGFVLLLACANVANLLLVRGMEHRQQVSLSMALGARPSRLIREALTESIVLAFLGGAAGLAIAFFGTQTILRLAFQATANVPISATPSIPVLVFALTASLITGIFFGIAPAWLATHGEPIEALRGSNRSTRETGSLPRKMLVVLQAAFSVVLLSASGWLLQSLRTLENQNFGFEQSNRTVIKIDPVLASYAPEQLESLYNRIQDSLAALPGVISAASALYTPLSGDSWSEGVYVKGKLESAPNSNIGSEWSRVSPGFFDTIGNPIVKGRPINKLDTDRSRHVAVVNESFARKFFNEEDPIGKHFGKGGTKYAGDYEIVGVARDVRYVKNGLDEPIGAFFFLPQSQSTVYTQPGAASTELRSHYLHDIVVRTNPGANLSDELLRRALASVDPNLPIMRIRKLDQQVASTFTQQRLLARMTTLFGMLAVVLASIGLYGVTSYNVGRRTNEIGVRMALGADRGAVLILILKGAFALIGLGLFMGIPLTVAAGRFLGSQIYGLSRNDAGVIAGAAFLLGLSALIAALIPALRATLISPLKALRSE
jgi:predicted permease